MKLMLFKRVNYLLLITSGLLLMNASCSKTTQELIEAGGENPDLVTIVDANFDWSTAKTIDIRVPVDDQYEGQYLYKLEIFDREPHLEGATLLGAGLANKGQDLVTKIRIPSNLTHVFVQKTTPTKEVSYSILAVNNTGLSNGNKLAASTSKVAAVNLKGIKLLASTTPISSTAPANPSVPNDALEINGGTDITTVPASKSYVIRKGESFAGNIAALDAVGREGIVVYVEGKWHHTKSIEVGKSSKIIILKGGELNVEAINLNDGTASLENHGDLLLKALKINANNSFKNVGTLKIFNDVAMVGKAEFVNYQKAYKVKIGSLSMRDADCVMTNNGEIEILEGTFNNGTLNANCYTTVGKMVSNKATVNIWSDAMLDVTNLQAVGGTYNLYSRAVLDVTRQANFKADTDMKSVVINSIGSDAFNKSYVRIKYVTVDASNAIHLTYNGNLIVVTDDHPRRKDNKFTTSNGTEVEIFWDRYNHPPYVAATNCNDGGAGTIPTTPPADQTLTEIKLGSYTYLFEDNWPRIGDYDMNDFVLSVEVTKYQNKSNKVEKIILRNKIYAIGAARRVAGAIQLDNILAGQVKSVTYSNNNVVGSTLSLVGGIESGQTKAVVTIVDDAHKAFGLTTPGFIFTDNSSFTPFESEIVIELNTPLADFTFDDLNPFIVSSISSAPGKRHEVHLVGYKPTDKIDNSIITNNQVAGGTLSTTDPFKNSDGWPFAIAVPTAPFKYQRTEGQHIKEAYPQFMNWVTSNGTTNQDWYNYPKK